MLAGEIGGDVATQIREIEAIGEQPIETPPLVRVRVARGHEPAADGGLEPAGRDVGLVGAWPGNAHAPTPRASGRDDRIELRLERVRTSSSDPPP